jgi:DNA-3-methyladenine glycosylase I
MPRGLVRGADGRDRCFWCGEHADYVRYHDEEWGHPLRDDQRLFEKLCLEGFQSGLSWLTILRKRENFRRAFRDFDFDAIARFNARSVDRLLRDAGIVRHRGKIESVLNNAKRAQELVDETGSLTDFLWSFAPPPEARPKRLSYATLRRMTTTAESTALSKSLKQRGWSFVGPTTAYAFMQSVGMVNDHLEGCWMRSRLRPRARSDA